MTAIACIEDLQKLAKRRVPRMFYDYADSGSWTESTYRANESDLAAIKFRQRVALDVSNRTTEMSMLGQKLPMPHRPRHNQSLSAAKHQGAHGQFGPELQRSEHHHLFATPHTKAPAPAATDQR